MNSTLATALAISFALAGCAADSLEDGRDDLAIPPLKADTEPPYTKCELDNVVTWLNAGATMADLQAAGVGSSARRELLAHRDGPDATFGTADDDLFDSITEVDDVPYVGRHTMSRLVEAIQDRCLEPPADPAVAILGDPTRPSLAQECQGTPLTASEVIAAFDPGSGQITFGSSATWDRAQLGWRAFHQACNPFTGCTTPTGGGTSAPGAHFLELRVTQARGLELLSRLRQADAPQTVSLLAGQQVYSVDNRPFGLLVTRTEQGLYCVSSVGYVITPTSRDYVVFRGMLRPSWAAGERSSEPQLGGCSGDTLSNPDIFDLWFNPAATTSQMTNVTDRRAARLCHPVTGCSAWFTSDNNPLHPADFQRVRSLDFDANGVLSLHLEGFNSQPATLTVNDGSFSGTDWSYLYSSERQYFAEPPTLSGRFTAGCVEARTSFLRKTNDTDSHMESRSLSTGAPRLR